MSQDWIGRTIGGRYVIESLLGQGGMSAVYRATDPNLRRPVAIKLIHPHLSTDPNFVGRFKEEAAAVARLRHPHIVQVHDFAEDGGTYYMVMEFLVGETLQKRLRRLNQSNRFMRVEEAVQCAIELCEAAGYAHNRDMVHRDIKPANILLTVEGQAVLTDFGIVKIIGGDYHTATGATLGTAMYMSPEQIRTERVDARADIYSLGVTLYEMLSGQPPYTANSAMTLMMMVLNDPLPGLGELRKGLPETLLRIVEKALAKEPAARYQAMDEMAGDLRQALADWAEAPPEPAETLMDEPRVVLPDSPARPPATIQDQPGEAPPEPRPAPDAPALPEMPERFSSAATVQDAAGVRETPRARPDGAGAPRKAPRSTWRVYVVVAGILLLAAAAIGWRFLGGNRPPEAELAPIRAPEEVIHASNAQFVVNLGSWRTDVFVEALAYSPDGSLLGLAGNRDGSALSPGRYAGLLLAVETGQQAHVLTGHAGWIYDVAFSPDGQRFSSVSDDGALMTWEIRSGSQGRIIDTESGGLTSLAFSPNGMLAAAGSWDGDVYLWEAETGNLLRTLSADGSSVFDIAFSPDGRLLAGGLDSGAVVLWHVSDGSLVRTMAGHTGPVNTVVFSPDGELLASASDDTTARIWQVTAGSLQLQFSAHQDAVRALAFSPDGSLITSGSDEGALYSWSPEDGSVLLAVTDEDSFTSLVFSPDGTLLVSASADGRIQFWGLSAAIPQE